MVVGAGYALWERYRPRTPADFPKLPIPKAFPDCPEVPTKEFEWKGLRFRYPAYLKARVMNRNIKHERDRQWVVLSPGRNNDWLDMFQSMTIWLDVDDDIRRTIDAAWNKAGQPLSPGETSYISEGAVPETMQALRIEGYRAFLWMYRGIGPIWPKEADRWRLFVEHPKGHFQFDGPALFNTWVLTPEGEVRRNEYETAHNQKNNCAFWSVIKSARFP